MFFFFAVWIVNDSEAKELELGGTPTEQILDWSIDHPSPVITNTGPIYYLTGPNPVTQTLNNIEYNAIQSESSVVVLNPNVQPHGESDQATFQNGRQIDIELLNDMPNEDGGQEVDIPKINLELDEECNWFEKTYNGSKLQKP